MCIIYVSVYGLWSMIVHLCVIKSANIGRIRFSLFRWRNVIRRDAFTTPILQLQLLSSLKLKSRLQIISFKYFIHMSFMKISISYLLKSTVSVKYFESDFLEKKF